MSFQGRSIKQDNVIIRFPKHYRKNGCLHGWVIWWPMIEGCLHGKVVAWLPSSSVCQTVRWRRGMRGRGTAPLARQIVKVDIATLCIKLTLWGSIYQLAYLGATRFFQGKDHTHHLNARVSGWPDSRLKSKIHLFCFQGPTRNSLYSRLPTLKIVSRSQTIHDCERCVWFNVWASWYWFTFQFGSISAYLFWLSVCLSLRWSVYLNRFNIP